MTASHNELTARRVVTGHDTEGRAVILSDGAPPSTIRANGFAVAHVAVARRAAGDGRRRRRRTGRLDPARAPRRWLLGAHHPLPGAREGGGDWIRVEGDDPDEPGMHATDTLDFMVVVDGRIVLGLDDGEHELGAGDVVIQRGNRHRWRVVGDDPCTYVVCMLRPDPDAPSPAEPQQTATTSKATGRVDSWLTPTRTAAPTHSPTARRPPRSAAVARRWSSCGRPAARSARPTRAATPQGAWELGTTRWGNLLSDRGAPTRVRPR